MALTKTTQLDSLRIHTNGVIEILEATHILEDGQPFGEPRLHSRMLAPGDSLEGESARVSAHARADWTSEIVAAYQATQAAAAAELVRMQQAYEEANAPRALPSAT